MNEDGSTTQGHAAGSVQLLSASEGAKGQISVVTTDFGADCDDQKAISQHIAGLGPDDRTFFIVNGPHPDLAAAAIAQAYFAKTRRYPVIALGRQFEAEKIGREKIFSLANGEPMLNQSVDGFQPAKLEDFHAEIDKAVKREDFSALKQCVFGPLHNDQEYYDPSSRMVVDKELEAKFNALSKTATVQFQCTVNEAGELNFGGNNANKSAPAIPLKFSKALSAQGYITTYFDGAVAKNPEFLLLAKQEKLPGVEKPIGTYMENLQTPWSNMPGPSGTTPAANQMRVGMLTPRGEVPFGAHVSGSVLAGFGLERLATEVCGLKPGTQQSSHFMTEMNAELDAFDDQVHQKLKSRNPHLAGSSVADMRNDMHGAMMTALQTFADRKEVSFTSDAGFAAMFGAAKEKQIKLNPYTYVKEFKPMMFEANPIVKDITTIAEQEAFVAGADGKSRTDRMTAILLDHGARAVMYDAVALAAADVVDKSPKLAAHFAVNDNVRNITPVKVAELRSAYPGLYKEFSTGIRQELARDGGALALGELHRSAPALSNRSDGAENPLNRGRTGMTGDDGVATENSAPRYDLRSASSAAEQPHDELHTTSNKVKEPRYDLRDLGRQRGSGAGL